MAETTKAGESAKPAANPKKRSNAFKSRVLAATLAAASLTSIANASPGSTNPFKGEQRPRVTNVEKFMKGHAQDQKAGAKPMEARQARAPKLFMPRIPNLDRFGTGFEVRRPEHHVYMTEKWRIPDSPRARGVFFSEFFGGVQVSDAVLMEIANDLNMNLLMRGETRYLCRGPEGGLEVVTEYNNRVTDITIYMPQATDRSVIYTYYTPDSARHHRAALCELMTPIGSGVMHTDLNVTISL